MKNTAFALSLVVALTVAGYAGDGRGIVVQNEAQRLVVPVDLQTAKEGEWIFIAGGKEEASSKGAAKSYGMLIRKGKNILSRPLVELRDASTKDVLRKITVGEFFGIESGEWKALPGESMSGEARMVRAFSFTSGGQHFKFYRTIESISDEHFPGGKGVMLSLSVAGEKPLQLVARFTADAQGVSESDKTSWYIGDSTIEEASRSLLVFQAKSAASVEFDKKGKKGEPVSFMIESSPVTLSPNAKTALLSIIVAGTTVGEPGHAAKQARNLVSYLNGEAAKPELVTLTSVDRNSIRSGDTLAYAIDYHNIGTTAGKDIEIHNPVPAGTQYLENTAEGSGGAVAFTRSPQNEVTAIGWKFDAPVMPGEHRSVKFKVVVR